MNESRAQAGLANTVGFVLAFMLMIGSAVALHRYGFWTVFVPTASILLAGSLIWEHLVASEEETVEECETA